MTTIESKLLRSWMKPIFCDGIIAIANDDDRHMHGSAKVAAGIAASVRGTASYLFGSEAAAVKRIPALARLRDEEAAEELVEAIDTLLEDSAASGSNPEECFVLDPAEAKPLVKAVLETLGMKFGKPAPVALPRDLRLVLERLIVVHRAAPAASRGRFLERLTNHLSSLGLDQAAGALSARGPSLARVLEDELQRHKDSAPKDALPEIAALLQIRWSEDAAPRAAQDALLADARPYDPRERYRRGESCNHAKFGVGWVEQVTDDSISIRYPDGTSRKLVHGRA